MRARHLVAIGAIAYAAFLVATIPASLLATRAESWTRGQVRLTSVTGTVWGGTATPTLRVPGASDITLDRVTWSWQALALFRGQLALDVGVTMGKLDGRATVFRTPLAWEARALSLQGPVAALSTLHPVLAAWQPSGSVSVESRAFRYDGKTYTGTAWGEWRDASLSLSPVSPLGAWRLDITAENGPAKATLMTQRGPLRLAGQGTLTPAGKLTFAGEARAETGREADLASLLSAIGPKRADGAHAFSLP
jgi:general secretion pathway protein N